MGDRLGLPARGGLFLGVAPYGRSARTIPQIGLSSQRSNLHGGHTLRLHMIWALAMLSLGVIAIDGPLHALTLPQEGDWVRYKLMSAVEGKPPAARYVTITIGRPGEIEGGRSVWWQMAVEKKDGGWFVVQALSERAPMCSETGDIGAVYRYIFQQQDRPALEYVDGRTGLARLPVFGFREALIPTPRSRSSVTGSFLGTGNYLGQALAVHAYGAAGKWRDLQPVRLVLDDDVLIGTARQFRDDGTGPGEDKEYRYVELTAEDYDRMIGAGFNLFMVSDKHADYLRERPVFFIKGALGNDPYPELFYRSNYWGTAMFTDEPAVRMDASECRSIHDAANLLRLRNYAYHLSPGSHVDRAARMVLDAGFSLGDWNPRQLHIPVWETAYESAFYQMQGGAAGMVHEGRYQLGQFNSLLSTVLGPGAEVNVAQMLDLHYCFMRGAARCFGKEWGTAIYGQCDYSIADDAIKRAYDQGAHFVWFWTSDHDHHLPFTQQLELAAIMRAYQQDHPRGPRRDQVREARVAVAIPDGYMCGWGTQWGQSRFRADRHNERGVPYGDVNAEAYWQMYRLAKQGIAFDALIDVPEVIDLAGYDRIIRVGADGLTNLPGPAMPRSAPRVSVTPVSEAQRQHRPRSDAPKTAAAYVKPGAVKIDGNLAEWKSAQWIDLKQQFMYDAANGAWGGAADLSAQVAFYYDEDAVYIAARVTDDQMAAQEREDLIWQNDCLQIAFDPLFNPHAEGYYASDDVEIGFSLVGGKPYAYRWTPSISGDPAEVPGVEAAIVREGTTTIYEARVPFSSLTPLSPSFPGRCGMCAVVNDADGDGLRKGAIGWTSGLADGKNPSRFGVLEFAGSERLKDPPPIAFAQAERTVVRRGESVVLRLDSGGRAPAQAELALTVRHGASAAPASTAAFRVPAGLNRFRVALDTSALQSDSYKAELAVVSGGSVVVRQSIRFYVEP